jgi:sarcosine oxidase subunit gamma
MLNYNSPINDTKKYSEIEISEIEPIIKLNLRGKNRDFITKVGKVLSIIPPTDPNTSSGNDNLNMLWLSPDEWMIYYNNKINLIEANNLEDNLFNEISKVKIGSVTNITDHWIVINIKGDKVFELLSSGSPFNFNIFKNAKGAVTQTLLNHIDVIIHNKNINDLNLFVRRSFSEYLWSWINDCASKL